MIQPRHFYGDTPTPPPPQTKLCSRSNHQKPLADYIDSITGKQYNNCNECRLEVEQTCLERIAQIKANIQIQQDEFERIMGLHGNVKL
jgi:hypothetical protein